MSKVNKTELRKILSEILNNEIEINTLVLRDYEEDSWWESYSYDVSNKISSWVEENPIPEEYKLFIICTFRDILKVNKDQILKFLPLTSKQIFNGENVGFIETELTMNSVGFYVSVYGKVIKKLPINTLELVSENYLETNNLSLFCKI